MPSCFDVYDGRHLRDDEAIAFQSMAEARAAAVHLAAVILKDGAPAIAFGTDRHMDVVDGRGWC